MKTLPRNRVLVGDAAEVLAGLLPESVDCLVTSPPYAGGVRNYGHPEQLGQERDVGAYVAAVTAVLRRARRILKPTGTAWLNVGDVYSRHPRHGAPAKSLLLAPQRLAVALAADGWIIRNHLVWAKTNALPHSAGDRLSPTWESLLLLAKSPRYFFDLSAIRMPHASTAVRRPTEATRRYQGGNSGLAALKARGVVGHPDGKNPGDVWTTATAVDRLGHQATFPETLIERPILASCPEAICVQCDRPWTRPVRWQRIDTSEGRRDVRRVAELRRCDCFAPWRPGVVLDPFFGSGTVGVVAERLGRDWLGIDLHRPYARMAEQRIAGRRAA